MTAFHLAIFTSAFLLFLVQPLIAKQILPWFGGAPSVWSTCLVFFQLALVAGYGYAHLTRRLGIRRQVGLHLLLVLAAIALLPIAPSAAFKPAATDDPSLRVFQLLSTSVGIPYVLLAATAPMLQDWYARARPGQTPYPLYALSNAGSLLALLSFPVAVERSLDGRMQAALWSAGFVLFAAACAWCGRQVVRAVPSSDATGGVASAPTSARPEAVDVLLWFALSACGTGLLLAVTNQLCQEVATVPLLWVLPLTVYLVSFILAFAGLYARALWLPLFAVSVAVCTYVLARAGYVSLPAQGASLLILLAAGCMVCHGELARLKPRVDHLTGFYLALSIGGSAGGIFVALVAPRLFLFYAELPFFVLFALGLQAAIVFRDRASRQSRRPPLFLWAVPLAVFVATMVVALQHVGATPGTIAIERNFYGVLRVVDGPPDQVPRLRKLFHGRVLHGAQFLDPDRRDALTIDFAHGSGIDLAFAEHPRRVAGHPMTIGVVGLGAGTIAAFGRAGDSLRFFELNPTVITFARDHFTFLRDSPATVDVVAGDARLSLETEMATPAHRHTYDLLVVDAFAGAAIPVHLLTRESMALYQQALTPDGVLVVHVSNQHLDLTGVVRGTAGELGLEVAHVTRGADARVSATSSEWMVASRHGAFIERVRELAPATSAVTPAVVWTDAFSSLASVLR
jgi:spermidine synthase